MNAKEECWNLATCHGETSTNLPWAYSTRDGLSRAMCRATLGAGNISHYKAWSNLDCIFASLVPPCHQLKPRSRGGGLLAIWALDWRLGPGGLEAHIANPSVSSRRGLCGLVSGNHFRAFHGHYWPQDAEPRQSINDNCQARFVPVSWSHECIIDDIYLDACGSRF